MTRKNAATKPVKAKTPKPVSYLEKVMFRVADVKGKSFENHNMDYITPKCINDVEDGDVLAVYQFTGIQRVKRTTVFADATTAEATKAAREY